MAKGIGRLVQIGIARETSRGTPISSPTYMIPWAELDLNESQERVIDEQALGRLEGSSGESIVKKFMEGTLKAPIGDQHFPLILQSIFGTLTTTTGTATGTPYFHDFTVQQGAQHQSLTIFEDDPTVGAQDYRYPLTVISQLEISYEREQFLSYTATIRSRTGTASSVTAVAISDNRFLPQHLTFKHAAARSALGAASAIALKSARIVINQNVEDDDVLGSDEPADFLAKQFTIEGEIEALFQNESDFKTQSLSGTARALRFDVVNTGTAIGTGTANPSLLIDITDARFMPITKPLRLNDLVMQRVSFRAHYKASESLMAAIRVTNNVSSY